MPAVLSLFFFIFCRLVTTFLNILTEGAVEVPNNVGDFL